MNAYITVPLYDDCLQSDIVPEIYVYLPKNSQQPAKAVVISGGGGFNQVNLEHEGHQFAQWLSSIGVAGVVLNYRLPQDDKLITEADLRQAVRIVRKNAEKWHLDKSNIGAAGFSIGGHAVSLLAVREELDSKLDFTMLFYAVVSMDNVLTHLPSRNRLLGEDPTEEEIDYYSSIRYISASTPKSLIMASNDDAVVSPLSGIKYYEGLKNYDTSASLYIFPTGGHGWGMKKDFLYHDILLILIEKWLEN